LTESFRRGDTVTCRQLYQLATSLSIPKGARTYEMLLKAHSSDSGTIRSLFEELTAEGSEVTLTEALAQVFLGICASNKDAKLAAEVFEKATHSYGGTPDHALFAALIKVYTNCELYEKATAVYEEEMVPKQMKPDPALSDLLMKAAVQAGRGSLAQGLFEQSPGDVAKHVTMIKACGKENNLKGAVNVFNKLKQGGVHMNSLIYNCLLDACVQCGDSEAAHEHFQQMKELAFVDVVSYNTMLKSYLRGGMVDEASQLLQEMTDRGLSANNVTYNELLNAKVQSKDRRGMWQLLEQMQAARVKPSGVTCSILLKSLTVNSHSVDVTRTMDLIDQMDEPMDEVLFSSVIEACIRVGQLDLLSAKMRTYASQGGLMALTAPTYGSMIKAYGRARDVERLWELWTEMRSREVKPTAITVGCMIDALVMNNCVDDAWDLVQKVYADDSERQSVNTVIYSTILKGFAMSKQPEKLAQVYAEMKERDIACNTISYNTMLDACAKCGAMHRVPQLLEDMKTARPRVEPDVITYSTIVKGYCMSGDIEKAFDVLQEMKRDGKSAPDEILFNSLLDGCAKQNRLDDALKLLDDMQDMGVVPSNYTLSILVKLLGRSRRLNQAFTMVETICRENGFRPNIFVYTCLMQACIQNRQLGRAIKLHDQVLNEGGCIPDQKTYACLARGCLNAGAMEKAVEVIRCAFHLPGHGMVQMKGRPCGVDTRMLEEVVMKLNAGSRGEVEVCRELLADLKTHQNISVQDNVYSQVVRQAAGSGGFQQRGKGGGKGWSSNGNRGF
jgi:pentatricopeptide repeat protein